MPTTRSRIEQVRKLVPSEGPAVLPVAAALVILGWLPTVLLAGVQASVTGRWPAVALAFETHVRYLVAGPVLLFGIRLVNERITRCAEELVSGGFVRTEDLERYRPLASRLLRLGDSTTGAAACFAVALASAAAAPMGPVTDWASRWEGTVGLTLFRFVILRGLWRWCVWALFLGRVSRFDLALVATHPDLGGGLGFLTQPSEAFASFVLGVGAVIASKWSTEVLQNGVPFLTFKKELSIFAVLVTLLGILPLLAFTGQLIVLRTRALRAYGAFARDCCARFERKWVRPPTGEERLDPLLAPDLQSLSSLANSFDVVARSRPFLATPRLVATLAPAALLPMVPLFMTLMPIEVILPRLIKVL